MTASNFKIEFASGVTETEIDGKHVLFSKKTGDFFGLNDSAQMFLEELCHNDFSTTLRKISERFLVSEAEISTDILSLLSDLEKSKLIHKIPIS